MDITSLRRHAKILMAWGFLCFVTTTQAYTTETIPLYGCQGKPLPVTRCGRDAVYDLSAIIIYTSGDPTTIQNANTTCITGVAECNRKIHTAKDSALNPDYRYLVNWIYERCQGLPACKNDSIVPEWWRLVDEHNTGCNKEGAQYVTGVFLDVNCKAGEDIPIISTTQPATTPKTRPTTPTTTQPFPVVLFIYQPVLEDREKIILGVAIGLAVAILIVVLVILYCCERYRHHKKFSKLLAMLGAPQAQDDGFDDLADYATTEAWKDEADASGGAIGEYTGVKPNEFMTLDKTALESSGQIMYDQFSTMTMGRNTSCSTLGRGLNHNPTGKPVVSNGYDGPMDYETDENLELEWRMAENFKTQFSEEVSPQ